jgi:hypothetical protein
VTAPARRTTKRAALLTAVPALAAVLLAGCSADEATTVPAGGATSAPSATATSPAPTATTGTEGGATTGVREFSPEEVTGAGGSSPLDAWGGDPADLVDVDLSGVTAEDMQVSQEEFERVLAEVERLRAERG